MIKKKTFIQFMITADIHSELIDIDRYDEMISETKKYISDIRPSAFIIAGDLVNSRTLRVETSEYRVLVKYVTEIYEHCKQCKVQLIILRGTPSHDGDVVKTITETHNIDTYIDIMCIRKMFGMNILFMPELHYAKYEEFETELNSILNGTVVDIVIFHGMFDFGVSVLKQRDSSFNLPKGLIIDSHKFRKVFKYLAIGGHVHEYINKNDIWYTGRPSNEIGRYSTIPYETMGYKLVTIVPEDETYSISNLPSALITKQYWKDVDFTTGDLEDKLMYWYDIADKYPSRDEFDMQICFNCLVDDSEKSKLDYKIFIEVFKPRYFRRRVVSKDEALPITADRSKETFIEEADAIMLLKSIYKDKFNTDIPQDVLDLILNGDEGDD